MAEEKQQSKAEREDAARKRKDYLRALEEELAGVTAQGKPEERIAAVKAEIARVKRSPAGRAAGGQTQTA